MPVPGQLAAAVAEVRAGTDRDAVAGAVPSYVALPGSVAEVAAVVRAAAEHGLPVLARGGGTRLAWAGPPPAGFLSIDLSGLARVLDHAAGDMVVQVQAGVPLRQLAEVVGSAGQQLVLDAPSYGDGGTVGGALAAGLAGPRQLRYGGPRDLLLGVRMVRADGVVASAGGRVVKNVAGYDLGKLLTGSWGTLGLIVEATLRLHPRPAATRWVSCLAAAPAGGYASARVILDSQLSPSAVELDRPEADGPIEVVALFEGTAAGVADRAAAAVALLTDAGAERVTASPEPPDWFGRLPGEPAGSLVALAFPPDQLVVALDAIGAAGRAGGFPVPVRGGAGGALLHVGVPAGADPAAVAALVAAAPGVALLRHAPPAVWAQGGALRGRLDPGAAKLMRRVKERFDPEGRFPVLPVLDTHY